MLLISLYQFQGFSMHFRGYPEIVIQERSLIGNGGWLQACHRNTGLAQTSVVVEKNARWQNNVSRSELGIYASTCPCHEGCIRLELLQEQSCYHSRVGFSNAGQ